MFAIAIAIAVAARDRSDGHPLWHLLIVAGGAVLVFVGIKAKEHWDRNPRRRSRGAVRVDEPAHAPRSRWSAPTFPIMALALLSAASGAIHSAVSAEHFQEAFIYGVFFLTASTLQAGWAVLLVYRPQRTLLTFGAIGNTATIILWTLTRTVGLPFGPQPWRPEAIGIPDLTSTLLELAIVVGAATLLARRTTLTPPDTVTRRLATIRAQHPTFIREHNRLAT
jgi:threonine/homoserine/homoserine lactone efflux protein